MTPDEVLAGFIALPENERQKVLNGILKASSQHEILAGVDEIKEEKYPDGFILVANTDGKYSANAITFGKTSYLVAWLEIIKTRIVMKNYPV